MSTPQGAELSRADADGAVDPRRERTPWLRVAAVMVAWVAAQELTPSLSGIGDEVVQPQVLLMQGCVAAAIALLLTLAYPEDARMLFAYSRATSLYLLVPIAIVVYVARVGSAANVLASLWWTVVMVVWRWFLFGILQRRLSGWFSPTTVMLTSAALFGSWMVFGVVGPTVSEIFQFPLAVFVTTLLGALLAIIPSSIMLAQKNVHALVALNLVASTLVL